MFDPFPSAPWPDRLAAFSAQGPVAETNHIKPDITAPGWRVVSTVPAYITNYDHDEDSNWQWAYQTLNGTSMAAPHVAGVAAAMFSANPGLRGDQVREMIMDTATPQDYGYMNRAEFPDRYRMVDAYAAVRAALWLMDDNPSLPSAPRNFAAARGPGQVELSWAAPERGGASAITRYEVSSNGGLSWARASSDTSHTFAGLTFGDGYAFHVRAVNSHGNGLEAVLVAGPAVPEPTPEPTPEPAPEPHREVGIAVRNREGVVVLSQQDFLGFHRNWGGVDLPYWGIVLGSGVNYDGPMALYFNGALVFQGLDGPLVMGGVQGRPGITSVFMRLNDEQVGLLKRLMGIE